VYIFPSFVGPRCKRRCDSESADQEQGEISGNKKEELYRVPLVAPALNLPQQQHNVRLGGGARGRGVSVDLDAGGLRREVPDPAVGG
jgi:hypothetical protein